MRMAGPDYALFAVGLVLFSGAIYGLVNAESHGASATGLYSVAWRVADVTPAGAAKDFGTAGTELTFTVNQPNVAVVAVRVACNSALPGAAAPTVNVELKGPDGLSGTRSEACGNEFTVEVGVNPTPPTATAASGSSEDNARENLYNGAFTAPKGQGAWTAKITLSGGAPGALPVGGPAGNAEGIVKVHEANLAAQPR